MTSVWLFLEPLDVLYLRGNAAFGGPGDHAEALMPPWPSVFSGALRSALLARGGVDLGRFTDEAAEHTDDRLRRVLGTPTQPGNFRLSAALLARWRTNTNSYEPLFPLPQDLLVFEQPPGEKDSKGRGEVSEGPSGKLTIVRLRPQAPGEAFAHVQHSGLTPDLLVVYGAERGKPRRSWWLTPKGWATYLSGGTPAAEDLVSTSDLWSYEFRLGIARSRETYTVEEGRIYTTQAVAVKSGVGFLVGVEGCPEELFHGLSLVRLGGDGRGASVRLVQGPPWPDPPDGGKITLVLHTPGLFPKGWLLPGATREGNGFQISFRGFSAELRCAAVARAQVISGWDLPAHKPKPAQRAVPAGSVYFLDKVAGDVREYLDHLWDIIAEELEKRGGKDGFDSVWQQRKAEGFNNFAVGQWPHRV